MNIEQLLNMQFTTEKTIAQK